MNIIPDSQTHRTPSFSHRKTLLPLLVFALLTLPGPGQAPGVPIVEQSRKGARAEQAAIAKQARKLFEDQRMLTLEETVALLESPVLCQLNLPEPHSNKLDPKTIAASARQSGFRVGWAYLCNNCDNWHIELAGGYAVTRDGVIATCAHVLKTSRKKMRSGSLVALDHQGKLHPITSIIACDDEIDGALIKIEAATTPLPLNDQIAPGDPAYCLSRPLKQTGYFSQGMVNRFYWNESPRDDDPNSLQSLGALKMNVSTRWAPGSSGSAVLDACGNAIGHVATISTMGKSGNREDGDKGRTLITLHTATPARAMMALAAGQPATD